VKEETVHEIDSLRQIRLLSVLALLGVQFEFKTRKGDTEWYGPCPIHPAKTNRTSFSFDASGRFNCFSCGAKGRGAIDLVKAVRQVGFQEAVDLLRSQHGNLIAHEAAKPQVKQLQVPGQPATNPPFKSTYEKYAVDSVWLKERGLLPDTLLRYEVFEYNNPARRSAYSGSVMLKIRRYSDGECVGYLSRNIGEITPAKPKYLFPKGLQKGLELFGAWQLKNDASAPASLPLRVGYLVESPFAVTKFHQLGFAAVSPFGWSCSPQQIQVLCELFRGVVFLAVNC
jgi:DNA primase